MRNTLLLTASLVSTLLMAPQATAGSKWVRLGWLGDASSEATVSFTPDGTNNNPYVAWGYSTNESSWSFQPVALTTTMVSITSKHARLENLTPNSEVYFRICDDAGCGERFWFKTAPTDNSPFVFVAGGDTRTGWTNRQDGNRLISKIRPLFVMHGGDFTDSNNNSQWTQWLIDWELTYSSDTIDGLAYKRIYPMLGTHGNHEDGDFATICNMFGIDADGNGSCSANDTYYSVAVSPLLRVYTLNSQFMSQSSAMQNAQNNWLDADLSGNGGSAAWRVAQYHKPMFPHYSGKADNPTLFNWWAQRFFDHGMNLVVESDTHLTKITEVVAPSGSTFVGSAEGISAGTVYVGEGSWGAPARSANDPKPWTVDLASIQQFKVVTVSAGQMQLRTAQFDGSPSTLTKAQRDADSTLLPANINWWLANRVGEAMLLETDGNGRTVLAGGNNGGGGNSVTVNLTATDDTFISSTNGSANYNGSAEQLLADGVDATYGEMKTLIKWDLASIPGCATVEVAKVQLNIFNPSAGSYNLYSGVNGWSESTATWLSVGGAAQQGSQIGGFTPGSNGNYGIQLNATGVAAVQGWLQGSNNGIIISSAGTSDGIDINDRESGNGPVLTVTFNQDQCGSSNNAPVADFGFSANYLQVSFSDASSDSDGNLASWAWNFGDGNGATVPNPQHSYSAAGSYTVSLTVTDNDGASTSVSKTLTVSAAPPQSQTTVTLPVAGDTFISSTQASSNFNGAAAQLLADGYDATYGEMKALMQWDLSAIPSCARVEAAELTVNVFDKSSGTYVVYAGVNGWAAANASWNSVSGAAHQGSQVASFVPASTGQYRLALNSAGIAAVQAWLGSSANAGLVISSAGSRNGIDINDQESGNGAALTITYNQDQCAN